MGPASLAFPGPPVHCGPSIHPSYPCPASNLHHHIFIFSGAVIHLDPAFSISTPPCSCSRGAFTTVHPRQRSGRYGLTNQPSNHSITISREMIPRVLLLARPLGNKLDGVASSIPPWARRSVLQSRWTALKHFLRH